MAAEAVGLAASIAGLVGLVGQVLQGGLFIQQFFEGVRDAPAEVHDLRDELELFTFVASDTEKLLRRASETLPSIDTSNFTRTLKRCDRTVKEIGDKLAQCAGKQGKDKKLWWTRLKVASRKKALGDYMSRLDRAKGQLLVVQSNLTQAFLLCHQQSLQETTNFLTATSTTLNHIQRQGILLAEHVERMNGEFKATTVTASHHFANTPENVWSQEDPSPKPIERTFHSDVATSRVQLIADHAQTPHRAMASNAASRIKPRRMVSSQRLNFWLLRIGVDTEEETAGSLGHANQDPTSAALCLTRRTVHVYLRIPFFQRKLIIQHERPPYRCFNSLDMQFRMYNIIPKDAPIFKACRNFDLPLVQELLRRNAASPYDLYNTGIHGDISLIDEVFSASVDQRRQDSEFAQGLELLEFLVSFFYDCQQILNYSFLRRHMCVLTVFDKNKTALPYVDTLRRILCQCSENPFEKEWSFIHVFITLDRLKSPMSNFLLEQTYHELDTNRYRSDVEDGFFWENDRLMLADPEGTKMKGAILMTSPNIYRFYVNNFRSTADGTGAIIGLLTLVHSSKSIDLVECCRIRLVFLVQQYNVLDPVQRMLSRRDIFWSNPGFGVGYVPLCSLLRDIIEDLFNDELYAGVAQLVDGQVNYRSQAYLRKSFAVELTEGRFVDCLPEEMFEFSCEHSLHTDTCHWDLERVIKDANMAFRQKLTPGSWDSAGWSRLVPGVDFNPFVRSHGCGQQADMRDWLAYEDD